MRGAACALGACALGAFGCTATAVRSYEEPLAYVQFAAQEASATAGFHPTRVAANAVEGERPIRLGLLLGQGGEHLRIALSESGARTRAEITSRKRLFGFLAGRHQHERVAHYLDGYIVADRELRGRILGAAR